MLDTPERLVPQRGEASKQPFADGRRGDLSPCRPRGLAAVGGGRAALTQKRPPAPRQPALRQVPAAGTAPRGRRSLQRRGWGSPHLCSCGSDSWPLRVRLEVVWPPTLYGHANGGSQRDSGEGGGGPPRVPRPLPASPLPFEKRLLSRLVWKPVASPVGLLGCRARRRVREGEGARGVRGVRQPQKCRRGA